MVYADTSALVKLFIEEPSTPEVRSLFERAEVTAAVCRITWVEALAALAQRARVRAADEAAVTAARRELQRVWPHFMLIEITQRVVERAAEYADTFALRAYDAVQLAGASELALAAAEPVAFACFDSRLNKAARLLGLEAPFVELP